MKRFLTLLALTALAITANAVIQSGSCGDNVTFVLNDDGTLVISGSGEMTNYTSSPSVPWYNNRSKIIKAQIEDGVTSIGYYAFYYCSGLTSITIPNSVTSIGESAFAGCSGLTPIIIPNSVTSIGNRAFYECSGLTSVTIPNSVTSIGEEAFAYCSGLTSVTIPNSVTSIGRGAFYRCSGLTSITIPNSVTSIGNEAFRGCSGLTSVTIPNSVTSIGSYAFWGCTGLTSITIPNSVTSIGDFAFYGCTSLTLITIPNSVTSIGCYAFEYCSGLTSVTIPNSVTSIGDNPFSNCSGLISIMVEKGNPNYDSRDNCNALIATRTNTLISGCQNTIIPNSVTSIGVYAFSDCSGLTSVIIGNSVTSIGSYAFEGCTGLTSITIPNSVTSIGRDAFTECKNIRTVYWNTNCQYSFSYYTTYINELYYGDDITIVYKLTDYTSSLRKVVIGKNVEYIRQDAFKGAPLKEFYIRGEKDIYLYPGVFDNVNVVNCTLYVPKSRAEYYKTTAPWKDFGRIVDLDGNDFPEVTKPQCAAPTISYENGELIYATETEGATIVSQITDTDINKFYANRVPLTATYNITAYATKSGYDDSDVAIATLHWIDGTLDSSDGIKSIGGAKRAILVSSRDGMIKASGLNDGEKVEAYTIDGKYIGSANTVDNAAYISAQSGEVVVLKIGKESIKTIVK